MLKHLVKFQVRAAQLRDERGATAVEYGLMVALIAVVIIVAVTPARQEPEHHVQRRSPTAV